MRWFCWVGSVCPLTHAFARAPPHSIKLEHCIRLWSHPVFSSFPSEWPLLSAILKILLKTQRSRDKRALASAPSAAPSSLSAPAPPPRLSSHGRIMRITQFTPPKASNQWAAKPYWSESECQRRKGKGLNKNRKWNSTSIRLKRRGENHYMCRATASLIKHLSLLASAEVAETQMSKVKNEAPCQ